MMEQVSIPILANRRQYIELEKRADEHIKSQGWEDLLRLLQHAGSAGKARDAVVALLQLESVGGTDSDVFEEFAYLEGKSLRKVRADAVDHVMKILKAQIENHHTYFLDIEQMTMSPYVILVKDVIEARKRELERLQGSPSRIDVLGTYYGFQILLTDGSKPQDRASGTGYYRYYRRTWLEENISSSAAEAIKKITGELAEEVDMDKTYRTLGSASVFKDRCTKKTAEILANAVRIALYKAPGHRALAARKLGTTEDARVLPFLHHRLPLERNRRARIAMANALGKVGHESSIDVLKQSLQSQARYINKEGEAMINALGSIYSPQCKETLIELLEARGNTTKGLAIKSLGKQDPDGLVELLSPYLTHKSRPVVRSSVLALSDLGTEGEDAVRDKSEVVIRRIGYDKPSISALNKMLSISDVGSKKQVHRYFAKRIGKLIQTLQYWERRSASYNHYLRRREKTARQRLVDFLRLACNNLDPPFDEDLLNAFTPAVRSEMTMDMNQSTLARALTRKKIRETVFEQTFLSSYR
jgi:hypothetical protein